MSLAQYRRLLAVVFFPLIVVGFWLNSSYEYPLARNFSIECANPSGEYAPACNTYIHRHHDFWNIDDGSHEMIWLPDAYETNAYIPAGFDADVQLEDSKYDLLPLEYISPLPNFGPLAGHLTLSEEALHSLRFGGGGSDRCVIFQGNRSEREPWRIRCGIQSISFYFLNPGLEKMYVATLRLARERVAQAESDVSFRAIFNVFSPLLGFFLLSLVSWGLVRAYKYVIGPVS